MTQEVRVQICAALYEPAEWSPALQELLDERRHQHKKELLAEAGEEIATRHSEGRSAGTPEYSSKAVGQGTRNQGRGLRSVDWMNDAATALDLSPSSLRFYADQGLVPCFKFCRNRKFNLQEVRQAMEKAREEGKIPSLTDALRRKLLK